MDLGYVKSYLCLLLVFKLHQRSVDFFIIQKHKLVIPADCLAVLTRLPADLVIIAHTGLVQYFIHRFAAAATKIFVVSMQQTASADLSAMVTGNGGCWFA